MNSDNMEPILMSENGRFSMYPIQHRDLYNHYKKMEKVLWNAQKIDFSKDYVDYKTKLDPNQQQLVRNFSEIFAVMDGYISEVISENFVSRVSYLEAKIMYSLITHVENVHNETYSIMRDTLIPDPTERSTFINGISNIHIINKLKSWLGERMADNVPFAKKLVTQAFFEGVILLSLFVIPYQIKKITGCNILSGFSRTNEYINRDEIDHRDAGVIVYNKLTYKLKDGTIYEISDSILEILKEMISELFNVKVIGLNPELMEEHGKYLADTLMIKLGCTPLYGIKSTPITYMESVGLEDDPSFFEVEPTNYGDSAISSKTNIIDYDYNGNF